jgi:hypothetical protein
MGRRGNGNSLGGSARGHAQEPVQAKRGDSCDLLRVGDSPVASGVRAAGGLGAGFHYVLLVSEARSVIPPCTYRLVGARPGPAEAISTLLGEVSGLGRSAQRHLAAAPGRLDQISLQGRPGQVGGAAAASLVPDSVQVRADGTHRDVQQPDDLGVGVPFGCQRDQFAFTGDQLSPARPAGTAAAMT